jgi:AcrR family transcriptional regulator
MDKPSSVELLWGAVERPSRGPKPAMSLQEIVRAAVLVADTEGLGAVSMQRVAKEFGFTTMSLYRYVPGKSELVDLMIDTVVGPPPDLSAIEGWRAKLTEWAYRTWAIFQRHPWFLDAAVHRIMGPNQLGWLESAVAALVGNGLYGKDLMDAVLVINGHVRSLAPFTGTRVPAKNELSPQEWGMSNYTQITTHPDQFPELMRAIEDGAFDQDEGDQLEFGLRRILDGIEVLIKERAT